MMDAYLLNMTHVDSFLVLDLECSFLLCAAVSAATGDADQTLKKNKLRNAYGYLFLSLAIIKKIANLTTEGTINL